MSSSENIEKIKERIKTKTYSVRVHALERQIERSISETEIEEAILNGEIIEEYPKDKYSPSCLILGYNKKGSPLHIQCSLEPMWVITCYDPSEQKEKWSDDYRKRRE